MTVLGKVNLWLTGQHRLDKPKRKAPAAPTGGSPRSCNVSFRKDGVDYAFRERVPEKGEGCCGTSAPARPGVVCRGHRSVPWTRELFIGEVRAWEWGSTTDPEGGRSPVSARCPRWVRRAVNRHQPGGPSSSPRG